MTKIPMFQPSNTSSFVPREQASLTPAGTVTPTGADYSQIKEVASGVGNALDIIKQEDDNLSLLHAKNELQRIRYEQFNKMQEEHKGRDAKEVIPLWQKKYKEIESAFLGNEKAAETYGVTTKLNSNLHKDFLAYSDNLYTSEFSQGVNYTSSQLSSVKSFELKDAANNNSRMIASAGMNIPTIQAGVNNTRDAVQNQVKYLYGSKVDEKVIENGTRSIASEALFTNLVSNLNINPLSAVEFYYDKNSVVSIDGGKTFMDFSSVLYPEQMAAFEAEARDSVKEYIANEIATARSNDSYVGYNVSDMVSSIPLFNRSDVPSIVSEIEKKAKDKAEIITYERNQNEIREGNDVVVGVLNGQLSPEDLESGNNSSRFVLDKISSAAEQQKKDDIERERILKAGLNFDEGSSYYENEAIRKSYYENTIASIMNGTDTNSVGFLSGEDFSKMTGRDQLEVVSYLGKKVMLERFVSSLKKNGKDVNKMIETSFKNITSGQSNLSAFLMPEFNMIVNKYLCDNIEKFRASSDTEAFVRDAASIAAGQMYLGNEKAKELSELVVSLTAEYNKKDTKKGITFNDFLYEELKDKYGVDANVIFPYVISGQMRTAAGLLR